MKKVSFILSICFIATLFLLSCKKNNQTAPDKVLSDKTLIIGSDIVNNSLIAVDSTTLTFSSTGTGIDKIKAGSILVSDISNTAPIGFLRKVISISNTGGNLICKTQQAALTDAIVKGSVSFNKTFSDNDIIGGDTSGIDISRVLCVSCPTPSFTFSYSNVVYDADGNYQTTYDQITITGQMKIEPTFDLKLDIDGSSIKKFLVQMDLKNTNIISAESKAKLANFNKEIVLKTFVLAPFTINVAGLPVPIAKQWIAIVLGVDGNLTARITAGAQNINTISAGLNYENNTWNTVNTTNNNFTIQPVTFEGSAKVEPYLLVRYEIRPYGIKQSRIYVGVRGSVIGEATLIPTGLSTSTKWGVQFSAKAQMQIFDRTILDYEKIFYQNEFPIAQSNAFAYPILTTTNTSAVTQTTAQTGGAISSDGGAAVTARGICWSTSPNPTTINSKTSDSTGTGNFTSNITGLTANTTYYVMAYATNSAGTAYGNQVTFTTAQAIAKPIITTNSITSITQTTASGGGNVTSDGNATVTARGVCWSSSPNPTISNSKTIDGTGSGSFTSNITGLTPNTTYYVMAYASNSAGTAYGNQVIFKTGQQTSSSNWSQIMLSTFAMSIKTDGTLWAWGLNTTGELGDGTSTNRNIPTQIGAGTNWMQVACGNVHTVAIKADGTLWAWGDNSKGELGDGTTTNRYTPVQVGTASNWKQVACGNSFTLAIKTDGTLWAWGMNFYGELGVGSVGDKHTPTQIGTASNWKQVSCGRNEFTLAIKTDGTLWGWGLDGYIGNGSRNNFFTSPIQIGTNNNWNQLACGSNSTLALKTDGTLWAWGRNNYGQLGDGTTTDRWAPIQIGTANNWKQIACGYDDGASVDHSAAIKGDGTLWTWGANSSGALGDGTTTNRYTPVQIGTDNQWKQVACGWNTTAAIKTDGTLWEWGSDGLQNINSKVPVQIK